VKVEEQKRKAKFDFGLYCLEFCPLFTLAISRAIHVIWTHPSILSYPNIVLCRDEIFPLVSRFPLFDQNIWKQNMSNLLQTAKKWNFRVVYGGFPLFPTVTTVMTVYAWIYGTGFRQHTSCMNDPSRSLFFIY
jgi:hypothetical protein